MEHRHESNQSEEGENKPELPQWKLRLMEESPQMYDFYKYPGDGLIPPIDTSPEALFRQWESHEETPQAPHHPTEPPTHEA
jgi:hypothetical protein